MTHLFRAIKNILFWSYRRTAWQYDVLCALILAFIFLTPKSWFENSEPKYLGAHQKGPKAAVTLQIKPEPLTAQPDMHELERSARALAGRPDAHLREVRPVRAADGQITAYEVDID